MDLLCICVCTDVPPIGNRCSIVTEGFGFCGNQIRCICFFSASLTTIWAQSDSSPKVVCGEHGQVRAGP